MDLFKLQKLNSIQYELSQKDPIVENAKKNNKSIFDTANLSLVSANNDSIFNNKNNCYNVANGLDIPIETSIQEGKSIDKIQFAPFSAEIDMGERVDGSYIPPDSTLTIEDIQDAKHTGIHQSEMPKVTADGGNPQKEIIEKYKEPAPGVRAVQNHGITGKGVNVAVIDGGLTSHDEYSSQIKTYDTFGFDNGTIKSDSHAAAVVSQLAGKTTGCAPDAIVHYYAAKLLPNSDTAQSNDNHLKALNEIISKNKELPEKDRIQVVSVSWGFRKDKENYKDVLAAIKTLEDSGVAVFWPGEIGVGDHNPNTPPNKVTLWNGVGRKYGENPGSTSSAKPNYWSTSSDLDEEAQVIKQTGMKQILVPCDNKTVASSVDNKSFDYYSKGGLSWGTPTLAGIYALAKQVSPKLTPQQFHELAFETGSDLIHDGSSIGRVIDVEKLIHQLEQR